MSLEMDNLNYQLYCIEQEMLDKLSVVTIKYNGIVSENAIVVNESVKDTVMTYIRKVIAAIQNAWNNFKTDANEQAWEDTKKKYEKIFSHSGYIATPENFELPEFKEIEDIIGTKLVSFNQNDNFESVDDFISKKYSVFFEKEKSIIIVAKEKCFKEHADKVQITAEDLSNYIKFLNDYKASADSIATNIKTINSSSRTLEGALNSISANESYTLASTIHNYFTEADDADFSGSEGDNKKSDDEKNAKFSGSSDSSSKGTSDNTKKLVDQINIFFKGTSSILSAQMMVLSKGQKISLKITKEFGKYFSKEDKTSDKEDNKEVSKPEEDKGNESTEVKL